MRIPTKVPGRWKVERRAFLHTRGQISDADLPYLKDAWGGPDQLEDDLARGMAARARVTASMDGRIEQWAKEAEL